MFAVRRQAVYRQASGTPGPLQLLREAITEIDSRRRLIRYLVVAEMKKRGSDTLLGNIWWVLDPVLQMVVYTVFVTILSPRKAPDYPLFIFAAILPWKWFSSVVTDATAAVIREERLIKQIAFPKIILPVATATGGVVGFAWGLIPLLAVALLYGRLTIFVLWLPVIAVVQYVFSLAAAIFVSAANVFFRDLGNVAGHLLRLWWFLSPSLYSLAQLDDLNFIKDHPIIRDLAGLNPFAILFEAYRAVLYGTEIAVPAGAPVGGPNLLLLAALLAASVVLVGLAAIFFKRLEPEFAKVI
jgi:homopolymeric O-antigen transport system permease protein